MQTRGEKMLALRRAREAAAPAFLRGGYRPFFFGGAAWAVIALVLWLTSLAGGIVLPSAFDPLAWHRHEMLFGFVGAIVAGFLLTAIPNWTGRLPIAGTPLAMLFGLWLAARAAVLFSGLIGPGVAAIVDVGFYFVLGAVAAREVFAAKNRNKPIVGLIFLLGLANAADHAAAAGLIGDEGAAWRCAIALVVTLISLIGGRIVPSFTRNWLAKRGVREGLPGQPGKFDIVVIAATAVALLSWAAFPSSAVPGALLAASILGAEIPRSAAIHALTAGAMATMILAVMTRATLGHSGLEIKSNPPTSVLYLLVTAGAVVRVAAPTGLIDYTTGMHFSAVAWAGAFILFLITYGPILFAPRAGEKG